MGRSRDLADGTLAELNVDSNTLAVDATNNRVGIGTSSPSNKLKIYDSTATSTTFKANTLLNVSSNGSGADATINLTDGVANNAVISQLSGQLLFGTGAGAPERMRIDSSGRVTMPYQPAFSAYPSTKSISGNGSETDILMEYTLYNNGSHYNTSTGIFTCPVAGYYFASAMARWETGAFTQSSYIRLYISKNNSNYNSTYIHCINGNNEAWQNYMGMSVSGVVKCAANDTLRLKGGMDAGAAQLHAESGFHVMLLG